MVSVNEFGLQWHWLKNRHYFLDEPTTYLDISHQLEILELVQQLNKEQGCTIIMVLHDINQAIRFLIILSQ